MSNNKNSVTLSTIPLDAITSIKVSGEFHKRIVSVYISLVSRFTKEQSELYIKHVTEQTVDKLETEEDQINAVSLHTMIVLINDLEQAFKASDLIKEEVVEIPKEAKE